MLTIQMKVIIQMIMKMQILLLGRIPGTVPTTDSTMVMLMMLPNIPFTITTMY